MRQIHLGRFHVFGGGAGMGLWLINNILQSNREVFCYDINQTALDRLPSSIRGCFLGQSSAYESYKDNFLENDVLIFAVPPSRFLDCLSEVRPYIKKLSLLVCLNSVQGPAIEILRQQTPSHSYFMGCHPLFGHQIRSPQGYAIALTEYEDRIPAKREFVQLLSDAGLLVTVLSASDHDKYMSVIQSLAHFCYFALCKTLTQSNMPISELLKLKTPNFQFLYAFCSRVLMISPSTTAAIQLQELAPAVRKSFLECAASLNSDLLAANGIPEAISVIERVRDPLRGADVDEGARIAQVAVDALHRFESVLQRYKQSAKPFVFRHKKNGELRVVRVLGVDAMNVEVMNLALVPPHIDGGLIAVRYNEIAESNYRRMGVLFAEKPAVYKARKKLIELITSEEVSQFHASKVLPIRIEYNFVNVGRRGEEFFENLLPHVVPGLLRCNFISEYKPRGHPARVSAELTYRADVPGEQIIETIQALLAQPR